jgi:hypothetical protein
MDLDAKGKDPDSYSYQLASYHQQLWSKPLPSGDGFSLVIKGKTKYCLVTTVDNIEVEYSSDRIVMTMLKWKRMQSLLSLIRKEELESFDALANTIGSYIIFPKNQIDKQPTLNGIRGMSPKIKNRFDLTLECIRLFYNGKDNPLNVHLLRYKSFFDLFVDFKGYVDFFLLQDLVNDQYRILFWLPFNSFDEYQLLPSNVEEYSSYKTSVMNFVVNRNRRIINEQNKESFST